MFHTVITDQSVPSSSSPTKSPTSVSAKTSLLGPGNIRNESLQQHLMKPKQSLPQPNNNTQETFLCPGCQRLFDAELAYLAHMRVCPSIEWPHSEDNTETTSEDNTEARTTSEDGGDIDSEVKLTKNQLKKCGEDLDFRNLQADNRYHCRLCKFKTASHEVIRAHVRSKDHTEVLHQYVEKELGKQFNFFEKKENLLLCDLCGWQAQYRVEMEQHLCQRVHHENIMRLVDPEYTIFGKGTLETYNNAAAGILDLKSDDVVDLNLTHRRFTSKIRQELQEGDEVDQMLFECLGKRVGIDNQYYCKVCDFVTKRKIDMRNHMEEKKHKVGVAILKSQLAKNHTLDLSILPQSVKLKMEAHGSVDKPEEDANAKQDDTEHSRVGTEQFICSVEQSGVGAEQSSSFMEQSKLGAEQSGVDMKQSTVDTEQFGLRAELGVEHSSADVEQSKVDVEQSKGDVEHSRVDVEQSGVNVEQSRIDVEQSRVDIEQSRNDVEQSRVDAEQPQLSGELCPDESYSVKEDRAAEIRKKPDAKTQTDKSIDKVTSKSSPETDNSTVASPSLVRSSLRKRKPNVKYVDEFDVNTDEEDGELVEVPISGNPKEVAESIVEIKRGRGRPRKNMHPSTETNKKGPGRPRKDVQQAKDTDKKGPGRPRRDAQQTTETSKKGPGRPRKDAHQTTEMTDKKGPGRPKKDTQPTVETNRSKRGRLRKAIQYFDHESDPPTDEDDEIEAITPSESFQKGANTTAEVITQGRGRPKKSIQRGRGRPRKQQLLVELDLTESYPFLAEGGDEIEEVLEPVKETPKSDGRGRGRPKKNQQSSSEMLPTESQPTPAKSKVIKSKRKRGRPRRDSSPPEEEWETPNLGSKLFSMGFSCELCNVGFSAQKQLHKHVEGKKHLAELEAAKEKKLAIINCKDCPSVFLANDSFDYHTERHKLHQLAKPEGFNCDSCLYSFLSEELLTRHKEMNCKGGNRTDGQENNSNLENLDVDVNDEDYDPEDEGKRSKYSGRKPPGRRVYPCEICDVVHKTKKSLMEHCETMGHEAKVCEAQGKGKIFQCERCWVTFSTIRLLDAHLEKHTQTQQEYKICVFCNETVLRDQYKEHCKQAGHEEMPQPKISGFKCDVCDKVMMTSASLADHKYIHTGQRPHKCPMCPFRARRKGDISIHVKRHLGIKPYKCDQCEAAFVKKSSLARHKDSHDPNRARNIKCNLCDATFFNRVILRIHRRNIHNTDAPKIRCQEKGCTHACRTQSELKAHMRRHAKVKPWLCTTCGKTTASRKSLKIHQRLHSGDKPYKCTYEGCTYAARFDTHLRRHTLIHTGEKPYKCPHCPYRSNVQENLRKHIKNSRKHKGMKMYKCNRCNEWEGDTMMEMVNHIRRDHGVYVKRLDVAKETGILQKSSGAQAAENEAVESGEGTGRVDDTASTSSTELDIVNLPMMEGDVQNNEGNYEQQGGIDAGATYQHGDSSPGGEQDGGQQGELVISATLQPQGRQQGGQLVMSSTPLQPQGRQQGGQLIVKLEERVGDIFNSLMAGGLG